MKNKLVKKYTIMKINKDKELDYEHLGRYVFKCDSRACDPFKVADADLAKYYFRGTLRGKKNMSVIILRLLFEIEQQNKAEYIEPLRELYDKVWTMKDYSDVDSYSPDEGLAIMNKIADIAEKVVGTGIAYR